MMTRQIVGIIAVLFITPIILGLPWKCFDRNRLVTRFGYAYAMGYFVMLAIFEMVCFPAALLGIRFSIVIRVYSAILISCIMIVLGFRRRHILCDMQQWLKIIKRSNFHSIYLWMFVILFLIQLYYAIFYSRTFMAADGYVAFSTEILVDDYFYLTDTYTGLYHLHDARWLSRVIQSYNYFPAYVSAVAGIKPAIVMHTILYAMVLILAYGVYISLAQDLFFSDQESHIFLIVLSWVFIYGYHSHYSLTFRLLGPNSEGKAILAVVLTPMFLLLMHRSIKQGYRHDIGAQLFVLSMAACSLTLGGTYTMVVLLGAMVLLARLNRKSRMVYTYLLWGGSVPLFYAGLYMTWLKI